MKKLFLLCQIIFPIVLLTGCGVNKKIVFISEPSDALVLNHYKESLDSAKYIEMYKPSPSTQKVRFNNKRDTINISFEKRGYQIITRKICRYTDTVRVKLERNNEVPEKKFKKADLRKAKLIFLDANVEVIIHSGIGHMDKYTRSEEKTKGTTDNFYYEFRNQAPNNSQIEILNIKNDSVRQWNKNLLFSMQDYIWTLDEHRLDYMSYPPLLNAKIKGIQGLLDKIRVQDTSDNTYLLFIWAKCISETAGRKIGNVALAVGSGLAMGYGAANGYYCSVNFSALNFDSGTLLEFYLIDPRTSEVLNIDHTYYSYDITSAESLKKLIAKVVKYPEIEKAK